MTNILNLEDEKFKDITVQGHKFKIKYMSPADRVLIAQRRMNLQGGNPISAMTESDFLYFENIAINDVCIEETPEDFKSGESCVQWNNMDLINAVAHEIRQYTDQIEEKLKKNKPVIGSK